MWKKISIVLFVLLLLLSIAYLLQIYDRHKTDEINELYDELITNITVGPKETLSIDIVKEIIKNKDNDNLDITKVYLSEFIHMFNEQHNKNVKEENVDLIIDSDHITYLICYDKDIDYAYQYFVDGKIYKIATFLMHGRYYSVNSNNNKNFNIRKFCGQHPIFSDKLFCE